MDNYMLYGPKSFSSPLNFRPPIFAQVPLKICKTQDAEDHYAKMSILFVGYFLH